MKNFPKIIALSGYAGSGKDTFADALCLELINACYRAEPKGFASFIREDTNKFIYDNFQISVHTQDRELKEIIRPIINGYGDARCRQDQRYFCKRMEEWIGYDDGFTEFLVITDLRRVHELEWVKEKKGNTYFLEREGIAPNGDWEIQNTLPLKKLVDKTIIMRNFPNVSELNLGIEQAAKQFIKQELNIKV